MRTRRAPFSTLMLSLLVALALVPMAAVGASEEPAKSAADQGPAITLSGRSIPVKNAEHAMELGVWSAGRRAYGFSEWVAGTQSARLDLVAYDLDDLKEVGRVRLSPPALVDMNSYQIDSSKTRAYQAVDQETGTAYVAYRAAALRGTGQPMDLANPAALSTCGSAIVPGCLAGIHAVSPDLSDVRSMPFRSLGLDGLIISPRLLAMEFSPARHAGETAKLHLVIEDWTGQTDSDSALRHKGVNAVYVVQLDAATGTRDWALRIDTCTGTRESSNDHAGAARQAHAASIFRPSNAQRQMLYIGCHLPGGIASVIRVPLQADGFPAALPVETGSPSDLTNYVLDLTPENVATADTATIASVTDGQRAFPGQAKTVEFFSDPASERVLLRMVGGNPQAEVWLVFDGLRNEYVGTVGIGRYAPTESTAGFDRTTGRLYVLGAKTAEVPGGLFVADIRRTPIPQALTFPDLADHAMSQHQPPLSIDASDDARPTHVLVPRNSEKEFRILTDRLPLSVDNEGDAASDRRSQDLDEIEGVTNSTFDAAARGYGARILLVGGAEALPRVNAVDATEALPPVTTVSNNATTAIGQRAIGTNCVSKDRSLAIGFVGPEAPVLVDAGGSRGTAEPIVLDDASRMDLDTPASRCLPRDWQELFSLGLWGRPPVDEPALGWPAGTHAATCMSNNGSDSDSSGNPGDPVMGSFAAQTDCDEDSASGFAYARGVTSADLTVAQALSSFRIYRDPARGIVARVESVTRGVQLEGQLRIDTVRASAESWANGRRQSVSAADQVADYSPNCDIERSAGTCFNRHVFGVRSPVYSCGPCGDEKALARGLEQALGANTRIRLRQPDPGLARGAESGFMAAIQKPDHERFADLVLNNDLLQTVVPGLEIIRLADGRTGKGRQVFQFAGVEVSSSYGIQCLLVYDEATNTCAAEQEVPGSLTISLTDGAEAPLAGGAFEVRKDVDADGVVGLVDTLLADGACVTAADGIGTCVFEKLQPGSYLVTQTAAPAGFAKVDDTWVSEVASGEARTVAFTNTSNVSSIDVSAVDEGGKPISGAVFAVFADPDADGKVAADAKPVATCTTGADGKCSMSVPVGSYVLVQQSAPAGLEGIEPVAFAFASGGQTAAVGVTNYGAGVPDVVPAAGPVYTEPVNYSPPVETVDTYTPPIVDEPRISVPEFGRTVVKVIQAPGDVLRLLSRDPQQAAAWLASLILFALAAAAIRRRQQAMHLM